MANSLQERLASTAFAFRGYNVTNLGRSRELLGQPKYGPIVERYLTEASQVCHEVTGRPVDLPARAARRRDHAR